MGLTYKDAGVDIAAGNKAISRIKEKVESTFDHQVLTGLGGFGGLYAPVLQGMEEPVLVSGTDGVGTKLKIAFMMDKHDTIGIDLVAMCVNDVLAQGARPLFFLDYLATGKLNPAKAAEIVNGIVAGCKRAGCSLIGGETAELPDFYQDEEYDLAGFVVGLVDKKEIISGEGIKAGDKIIGLPSSGIHSNGYSLVRKVFFDLANYNIEQEIEGLEMSLGEELLKPTRIYTDPVLKMLDKFSIKGIAHITGGGFLENIPRILPQGTGVVIEEGSWQIPAVFNLLQTVGDIELKEMYHTFNMGIGMILVVDKTDCEQILKCAAGLGESACLIGEVVPGENSVEIK
ncbi:phosphoribosylformylglycinamidine cyclo-ligase [Iocasia frigidifontis]|uniref:Phosphoribosylformylglycinamidine cyclo-ligase n=1 Tax=Iocasia fonsfrigidae TaxID=2682810 RepID=A0A8A7KEB8_9FIRM|nr:phosphoribosylformylglycinamidine cyclo-ligase [Iocasia fonsfrigidae]QTL98445.1 phosphoribosylformylglycinamidine cyclo-ligase [Iocasia fonsfrigidae]